MRSIFTLLLIAFTLAEGVAQNKKENKNVKKNKNVGRRDRGGNTQVGQN